MGLAAVPGVAGLAAIPPVGAETEEEVTANATVADVTLDQTQLDALTALPAGVADQVLDRDPRRAREALAQIRQTGQEAIGELSTLVGLIREEAPTSADPQPTLADIERLVESTWAAGLDIHRHTLGPTRPLPAAVELNAYRVVQEGLTSALKHAGHAQVNVVLHYQPSNLEIEIVDDGRAAQRGSGGRHGLPGLRERVGSLRRPL